MTCADRIDRVAVGAAAGHTVPPSVHRIGGIPVAATGRHAMHAVADAIGGVAIAAAVAGQSSEATSRRSDEREHRGGARSKCAEHDDVASREPPTGDDFVIHERGP